MTDNNNNNISEEDKLWNVVQLNPLAFNQWTSLIGIIEKTNDIEKIRRVYGEFLNEFPLCFLYWKRLADHEFAHNNPIESIKVFENAVKSVTHSVDIWLNYVTHLIDKSYPLDEIRNVFKRGIDTIGSDYQSGKFWDKYIEFEMSQEHNELATIFNSILRIPIENLQIFNERFKDNIDRIKINDMLTPEEHKSYTGYDVETKQMVLQNRDKWYHETLEKINKRANFESVVNKRFFFHIQPIDDMTLSVWRSYFNFMESDTTVSQDEIIKLYERCLVPCCYYSEFWKRYIRYLESNDRLEDVELVYQRATKTFLKKRADLHLDYSNFVEATQSDIEKSKAILENIYSQCPNHIETILRLVSFKRRNISFTDANQFFKNTLVTLESDPLSYPFLSVNYISFLLSNKQQQQQQASGESSNHLEESREVLKKSIKVCPESKLLWLYYINFEMNALLFNGVSGGSEDDDKKQQQRIVSVYEEAINSKNTTLNNDDKLEFWNGYLQFSLNHLNDMKSHRALELRFNKIYQDGKPESKKRSLIDMNGNGNNGVDGGVSKRIAYSVPPTSNSTTTSTSAVVNNGNISPSNNNNYYQQQQQGYAQNYYSGGGNNNGYY